MVDSSSSTAASGETVGTADVVVVVGTERSYAEMTEAGKSLFGVD